MLWGIFELLRDIAVLMAAVGVAKWAWDHHASGASRRDEEARAAMARERKDGDLRADISRWGARAEALAVDISTRLDEVLMRQRDAESRMALKLAIHRVLHATSDPFLTLEEVRRAVVQAAATDTGLDDTGAVAGSVSPEDLRRCLIELVADGVVAQLEGDRYFVATDYDAEEDEA